MARNRTSGFGSADGLFGQVKESEKEEMSTRSTISTISTRNNTQDVQEVHEELPQTQGRKGIKAKRINMAFSNENHEWIKKEARRQRLTATQLVNDIIARERKTRC